MAVKKAKRNDLIVMYLRVPRAVHEHISKIVAKRGYPHTLASVNTEIYLLGLKNL